MIRKYFLSSLVLSLLLCSCFIPSLPFLWSATDPQTALTENIFFPLLVFLCYFVSVLYLPFHSCGLPLTLRLLQQIKAGLSQVQKAVEEEEAGLKPAFVSVDKAHLTLAVMHLPDEEAINR